MKQSTRLNVNSTTPLTAVTLFSGIGGMELGMHRQGFRPLLCVEIDPNARNTLKNWLDSQGLNPIIEKDVTSIDPESLLRRIGLEEGELDLLAGGPPCQSFSAIGKKKYMGDDRGLLIMQMIRYANALRPRSVVVEQVRGFKIAKGPHGNKGGALELLLDEFRRIGYNPVWKVLCAADYGVPQLRDRLFVVATLDGEFSFPSPTHSDLGKQKSLFCKPHVTVEQAISDLPPAVGPDETPLVPNHVDITPDRDRERIAPVPEGEWLARQTHLPDDLLMNLTSKDSTKFRRLAWGKPSLTVRGGEAFYHPVEDRYLTPRECMRIQGFPDDHELSGPIRGRSGSYRELDQHRLVGNAVPPALIEALARELKDQGHIGRVPALVMEDS